MTNAGFSGFPSTSGSPASLDARYAPAAGFGFPYTLDPGVIRGADSLSLGVNAAMYARVLHGGTISKIGVGITTQSGNISVAAFSNSGTGRAAVPGPRVSTSGAVACPAVGYQEISLGGSVTLSPGDWLGLSSDNVTAAFRSSLGGLLDNNLGLGRQFRQATAHPLPSAPSSLVATIGNTIVLIGVA